MYNLDTGAIVALDGEQTRAMVLSKSKKSVEEDAEVYRYLAENGWVFYTDKPVFLDNFKYFLTILNSY